MDEYYYTYQTYRGRSLKGVTKKMQKKIGKNFCRNCGEKDLPYELDHSFPVALGGKISCDLNYKILCKKCHAEKTKIDVKVIACLKKLGIIEKHGPTSNLSYINLEKIRDIYFDLFELIEESQEKKHLRSEMRLKQKIVLDCDKQ